MGSLAFHPLADAFPLMEGKEFEELVSSIKANGLRHAIITLDGMILDGRNRYRACEAAGVIPLTKVFDGGDPVAFVIDENVHRRHLKASQRAMVAAKLATFTHGGNRSKSPIGDLNQSDVARAMNVGKRTVERAAKVLEQGTPQQIASVERGETTVNAAEKEISPSPPKQESRRGQSKRTETMQLKGQIWAQLRDALNAISGLPLPTDVAVIARGNDRSGVVDKRLSIALNWLQDFSNAWNSNSNKDAA